MSDETKAAPSATISPEKAGWKTTEFWLSTVAMLVGAAAASGAFPDESGVGKVIGIAAMALSAMGYSVSRGNAKAKAK